MNVIELIGWAVVELQSGKPDTTKVREALERALVNAAGLELDRNVKVNALIRLAGAMGEK